MFAALRSWFSRGSPPALRRLVQADAPAMAELHAAGFHRGWSVAEIEALLADRTVDGLGAGRGRDGAVLDGFVLSRLAAGEAEILTIAVSRRARGHGIGRMLLESHLGRLAAAGTREIFLEVDEANAAARALYARQAFVEVGRRKAYYARQDGTRGTALVLRRGLG
jgi:[ribosomal protein S18]-alanine N-acetyltransferase